MSTQLAKNVTFELKGRNIAIKQRNVVSIPAASGVGAYSGDNGGRNEVTFAVPSSAYMDPRTTYVRCRVKLSATNGTGSALPANSYCMIDGTGASVFERVEINTGDDLRLETVNRADQIALFNARAKSESWRYNQGRKLMLYHASVDENLQSLSAANFVSDKSTLFDISALADGATKSKYMELCCPMSMLSGVFSTDRIFPLKHFNTHGGSALRVSFHLNTSKRACVVTNASGTALAGVDVSYEIDSLAFVYDELHPTEAYDMTLKESIRDAGADGLKIFHTANQFWSTANAQGSEVDVQVPIYEFSIRSISAWWRKQVGDSVTEFNISKWGSAGVQNFQTGFNSYTVPSTAITYENPTADPADDANGKNNARGYMELAKSLGKNGVSEWSSGFSAWEQTLPLTTGLDDAYHRVYAVNYDDPNNLPNDPVMQVNGHDNRQSASPAQLIFRRQVSAPYDANYTVNCLISSDRLFSITADRGVVPGTTA